MASQVYLRLLLRSLERDVRVGELLPVAVSVESDAETRLTLRFDAAAFELVSGSLETTVDAGNHDVERLYIKNAAVGHHNIDVLARLDHLLQIAMLAVRVHIDGE